MIIVWGKDQALLTGAIASASVGAAPWHAQTTIITTRPTSGGLVAWQQRPGRSNVGPLVLDWGAFTRRTGGPASASYTYLQNITTWGKRPGQSIGNHSTVEWGAFAAKAGASAFLETAVTLTCSATSLTPSSLDIGVTLTADTSHNANLLLLLFGVELTCVTNNYIGSGAALSIGVDLSCDAVENNTTSTLQIAVELICLPNTHNNVKESCLVGDGSLPTAPPAQPTHNRFF